MFLNIADIIFEIKSDNGSVNISSVYNKFVVDEAIPDITIRVIEKIDSFIPGEKLLYKAENIFNDPLNLFSWSVSHDGGDYIFDFFDESDSFSCRARCNPDFKQLEIAFHVKCSSPEVLGYPHGPVLLHAVFSAFDAFYLHASSVIGPGGALVFSGKSGKGKSTIAGILSSKYTVLNDDRIIIRRIDNNLFVFNSPLYEGGSIVKAPLDKMFFIGHGKSNILKNLPFSIAMAKIMANSIQHNFSQKILNQRLDMLYFLVRTCKVLELDFIPDKAVIEVIENA